MHSRQAAYAIILPHLLSLNAMMIITWDNGFVNPLSHDLRTYRDQLVSLAGFTRTPGPMVEARVQDLIY